MSTIVLKYENRVKLIYGIDICIYHIITYLIFDKNWDALPDFTWDCPFWYLAALSMALWACMVLVKASEGPVWETSLKNKDVLLWFAACLIIQPVFFCCMSSYTGTNTIVCLFVVYRILSASQMILFLQEVQEKIIFLQYIGVAGFLKER